MTETLGKQKRNGENKAKNQTCITHSWAAAHKAFGSTKMAPVRYLCDNMKTQDQSYRAEAMLAASVRQLL